jgi:hypothetical protein
MNDICEGCPTQGKEDKSNKTTYCNIKLTVGNRIRPNKYVPEGWNCPCSDCLVKAICTKTLDCPDVQNYYAVGAFCKSPCKNQAEQIFINYLDRKFQRVDEYPPVIKKAVDEAFGYPK